MRKKLLFIFAGLVVLLAAVTIFAPRLQVGLPWDKQFADRDWRAVAIGQKPVPANMTITVNFDSSGQLGGRDGCNSYSGSFSMKSGRLEVADLTSTAMACDTEVMATADAYNIALRSARSASVESGILTIKNESGTEILSFRQK